MFFVLINKHVKAQLGIKNHMYKYISYPNDTRVFNNNTIPTKRHENVYLSASITFSIKDCKQFSPVLVPPKDCRLFKQSGKEEQSSQKSQSGREDRTGWSENRATNIRLTAGSSDTLIG